MKHRQQNMGKPENTSCSVCRDLSTQNVRLASSCREENVRGAWILRTSNLRGRKALEHRMSEPAMTLKPQNDRAGKSVRRHNIISGKEVQFGFLNVLSDQGVMRER